MYQFFVSQLLKILAVISISYAITLHAADTNMPEAELKQLEKRIAILQADMQNVRTEYGRLQRQLQLNEENIGEIDDH